METRVRKQNSERRDAAAGEAITDLPNHLVVEHILRSEHFDDPADLARLPAVSREMRDAVAVTGLVFEELDEHRARKLGYLSAVQRLQRGGRLSRRELLCLAAARGGHLEKLKELRENDCPWNGWTCAYAAEGGHLEVLQWTRANGCPWGQRTCAEAAAGEHLDILQYARANGCQWNGDECFWARNGGHLEMLEWLHSNGCPDSYDFWQ
jgi:hypothetical protein|tara:strand:+ start:2150 stop:2776 length:627 start_codon:yes stop_codon:yes gene_type:complete